MTDDLLRLSRVDVDLGINFRPSSSCALNQKKEAHTGGCYSIRSRSDRRAEMNRWQGASPGKERRCRREPRKRNRHL